MRKFCFLLVPLMAALYAAPVSAGELHPRRMSLDEMFSLADSLNAGIVSQRYAVEEAKDGVKVAGNGMLPSISISASANWTPVAHSFNRDFSGVADEHFPCWGNSLAVEVVQVISAGGSIRKGIEASEIVAQMAQLALENRKEDVRFLITGNALEMLKIDNSIKVLDDHIGTTRQVLEMMKERYSEGTALKSDITRYELKLQNLLHSRIEMCSAMEIISLQLANALGLEGEAVFPDIDISRLPLSGDEYGWAVTAADMSPVLKSADMAARLSETREKIVKAELYPQITVFAGDSFNGPDVPTFIAGKMAGYGTLDKNFNFAAIGVGIRYNIDNLYKTGRKIRQSQAATRRAQAEYEDARQQIDVAVKGAYVDFRDSFSLLRTKEASSALAHENYELVSSRYENDLALVTELLDASAEVLSADTELVNSRITLIYNYYKLKYISGTL